MMIDKQSQLKEVSEVIDRLKTEAKRVSEAYAQVYDMPQRCNSYRKIMVEIVEEYKKLLVSQLVFEIEWETGVDTYEIFEDVYNPKMAEEITCVYGDSIEYGDEICCANAVKQEGTDIWISFLDYIDTTDHMHCAPSDDGMGYNSAEEALTAANEWLSKRAVSPYGFTEFTYPIETPTD